MGAAENQLKAMAGHQNDWAIPALPKLQRSLGVLVDMMSTIMASTEWEGATAAAADDAFTRMRANFAELEAGTAKIQHIVDQANSARHRAVEAVDGLPSSRVDPAIVAAARTTSAIVFRGMTLPADTAISWIEGLLGNEREEAAKRSVTALEAELADKARQLKDNFAAVGGGWRPALPGVEPPSFPDPVPFQPISPGPQTWTSGGGAIGGSGQIGVTSSEPWTGTGTSTGGGNGGGSIGLNPNDGSGSGSGIGSGTRGGSPSVDGDVGGSFPGGSISEQRGGQPIKVGGGLLPGIVGGGAGAAALVVGSKLATSGLAGAGGGGLGGGAGSGSGLGSGIGAGLAAGGRAGGGAGAGASPGGGGLLGRSGAAGGVPGAAGAGAGAGSGSASAAAGGRGGAGVMSGGMGGGSDSEKEKRSGLGGLIAPKLEDEQDAAPRSAAAGAGGRGKRAE